ncbi:hypothetical protein MGSAQ_000568, partial [marine sediment metagenome]
LGPCTFGFAQLVTMSALPNSKDTFLSSTF